MRSKPSCGNPCEHLLWRVVLVAILLSAAVSHGQDEDARQSSDTAAGPAPVEPATTGTEDTDTAAERERASPFEYEASEQISEDLSVSFPVDI